MIKVPKSNPQPQMPPMQEPPMMGQDEPQQGDMGMVDGMDMGNDMGNSEGGDTPQKKEIQQLTGKLSQKLTDYNNGQQQKDSELNKYVANMIVKQAVKGMEDADKNDVIGNLDDNSGDDNQADEMANQQQDMPMESVRRMANKLVKEIFNNSLVGDDTNKNREEKKITKPYRNLKSPFASNR